MARLTREAVLAAKDLPTRDIAVPEWGGDVLVRGMTGAERDRFEGQFVSREGKEVKVSFDNVRATIVALCAVDDAGKRLFSDDDAAALGEKSASALARVFDAVLELSGLKEKDVKELGEGLAGAQSGASTSA